MADLGDLIPLGIEVRDADGVLTNAGTVVLTITLPDGTELLPTVVHTSLGTYDVTYTPDNYGRHLVSWLVTDPDSAFTDIFDVRDVAIRSIMSLADAKRHLQMKSTDEDDELRDMIEAVTYAIERHRNETIPLTVYTEELEVPMGYTASTVQLDHWPVKQLISITRGENAQDVTKWRLDKKGGVIRGPSLSSGDVIVYQAGYTVIPAHYVLAAKIALAHLWTTQRTASMNPSGGFGLRNQIGSEAILSPSGLGTALPPRAIELIGPRPSMIV